MRSALKYVVPVLAAAAAVLTTAATAAADDSDGPQDKQYCVSSVSATKCIKPGNAEINASIPAPFPGPFGIYGPYWAS